MKKGDFVKWQECQMIQNSDGSFNSEHITRTGQIIEVNFEKYLVQSDDNSRTWVKNWQVVSLQYISEC